MATRVISNEEGVIFLETHQRNRPEGRFLIFDTRWHQLIDYPLASSQKQWGGTDADAAVDTPGLRGLPDHFLLHRRKDGDVRKLHHERGAEARTQRLSPDRWHHHLARRGDGEHLHQHLLRHTSH